MCPNSRLIYTLTYRALREFANGRKSVNPMEALHTLQTSVPFSVCGKTEDVMRKANRSFNERAIAPVGVHEALYECRGKEMCGWVLSLTRCNGASWLTALDSDQIHAQLLTARNRAYAHRVTQALGTWRYPLMRIDATAREIKHWVDMPLSFSIPF